MSGDGYASPVVGGGGVLVRDVVMSRNFTPSGGTAGWAIFANGLAYLLSVVIRGTFSSANYVPGVSGFSLDGATGSAELYDVTLRGSLRTQPSPSGSVVEITNVANVGAVNLYSGDPQEQLPASLSSGSVAGSESVWRSNDDGAGAMSLSLAAPQPGSGGVLAVDTTAADDGLVFIAPAVQVEAEALRHLDALDAALRTITGTTNYGAAGTAATVTFPYPRSGEVTVLWSSRLTISNPAEDALLSFEIRDTNAVGPVRFAANDNNAARASGPGMRARTADGLPTSGIGFARVMLKTTNAAATAGMNDTILVVQPSP